MPRFFSHPHSRKRHTKRSHKRAHKRSQKRHTRKQNGGRGGGGAAIAGASGRGALTTGATQVLNQLAPAPY